VPVLGRERVLKLSLNLRRQETPRVQLKQLNGLPALLCVYSDAAPRLARRFVFSIALDAQGRVCEMTATLASRKLRHVHFAE
jgi:hypothetical protein